MAFITLDLPDFAGQSGMTLDIKNVRHREVVETDIPLTEVSTGVFEGTSVDGLGGTLYIFEIKESNGNLLAKRFPFDSLISNI